jgi:hypothetical protein
MVLKHRVTLFTVDFLSRRFVCCGSWKLSLLLQQKLVIIHVTLLFDFQSGVLWIIFLKESCRLDICRSFLSNFMFTTEWQNSTVKCYHNQLLGTMKICAL